MFASYLPTKFEAKTPPQHLAQWRPNVGAQKSLMSLNVVHSGHVQSALGEGSCREVMNWSQICPLGGLYYSGDPREEVRPALNPMTEGYCQQ